VRCSDRADGDFRVDRPAGELAERRAGFAPGEWTWLRQVHGARVVEVTAAGEEAGTEADACITTVPGAVLAVHTADCVPIVLTAPGVVAAIHAGWRGVVAGVIPTTITAVQAHTDVDGDLHAFVGPHIRAPHYAFGSDDLESVVAVAGSTARAETTAGTPALDMTAAVRSVLSSAGVASIEVVDDDTADPGWFSHRTRADRERQVTTAWLEEVAT
jgi:hypothetical protein